MTAKSGRATLSDKVENWAEGLTALGLFFYAAWLFAAHLYYWLRYAEWPDYNLSDLIGHPVEWAGVQKLLEKVPVGVASFLSSIGLFLHLANRADRQGTKGVGE